MRASLALLPVMVLAVTSSGNAQAPVRPRPIESASALAEAREELALARLEADLAVLPHALGLAAAAQEEALAALGHAAALAETRNLVLLEHTAALGQAAAAIALPAAVSAMPAAALAMAAAATAMPAIDIALPAAFAERDDFADLDADAPAPWASQDPADSLYRAARAALNAGDFAHAAELFSRIHDEARFRASEYRAISYYYDALSRSRVGGRAQLERARTALVAMRTQHAAAWNGQRDAAALLTRVEAELARLGDVAAAREVQARAQTVSQDPCSDANAAVKIEALSALMQMDAARAMPILEEVLKNRATDACTSELRRRAIFIVSQQQTERSSAILLEAARSDPDPEVRKQAVFFLGQTGGDEALNALQSILANSGNTEIQKQALFAISQHPSPRAAGLLRDFAVRADAPQELRANAIFFLSQRDQDSAENARFLRELYPRLNDPEVRKGALFAISQSGAAGTADWLIARALDQNETMEIRKQALFLAGQEEAVPIARLSELYDRVPDRELRGQVVFALSQRADDPQAVDLLLKIAGDDRDPELRKQAIFWLGQSKDPRAAEFLLELIRK